MGLYNGVRYADGDISIGVPNVVAIQSAHKQADFDESMGKWLDRTVEDDHICYFGIYLGHLVIGQIFLHDIESVAKTALVGYHIFERSFRGRGFGTVALRLLQRYVAERTYLIRLCAITSRDNLASRSIGRKCGFVEIGPSREDPENGIVMEWLVGHTL